MVFPDGSLIIPRGPDYLSFGPFLEVKDFEHALDASQFDSAKHLRHSHGWEKGTRSRMHSPAGVGREQRA